MSAQDRVGPRLPGFEGKKSRSRGREKKHGIRGYAITNEEGQRGLPSSIFPDGKCVHARLLVRQLIPWVTSIDDVVTRRCQHDKAESGFLEVRIRT